MLPQAYEATKCPEGTEQQSILRPTTFSFLLPASECLSLAHSHDR